MTDSILRVRSFVTTLLKNKALISELVGRDLSSGHVGHGFGAIWLYIQPLVVIGTYMLIFGFVLGSKMSISESFPGDYVSYIIVGLVAWLLNANILARSPAVFSTNASLVKQVVFPVEVLPVASVIACFVIYIPTFVLVIAYRWYAGGGLPVLLFLLPVVFLLNALLSVGVMLLLSVTTPFFRDIREFVTVYLSVAMYFTPAIYLPDWVPGAMRPFLYLNPFSYLVWVYQDVLFFGRIAHGFAWVGLLILALVSFFGGLLVFRKIKPYLGNVL